MRTLRDEFDYPVIDGVADKYSIPERKSMEIQFQICADQIRTEMETVDKFGSFISDRTVIDNLAYGKLCRDASFGNSFVDSVIYYDMRKMVSKHLVNDSYDLVVFVAEYFPIEDNGLRCVSKAAQMFVYDFIKDFLKEWETVSRLTGRPFPVLVVKGTTEERVKAVKEYVQVH